MLCTRDPTWPPTFGTLSALSKPEGRFRVIKAGHGRHQTPKVTPRNILNKGNASEIVSPK